jgi:hypothetical protein
MPIVTTSLIGNGACAKRLRKDSPDLFHHDIRLRIKITRAEKRGTCTPLSLGMIICSTSNATIAVGSSEETAAVLS